MPVSGVLERVEVELSPILAEKAQKLVFYNQIGDKLILVDEARLMQVLVNLVKMLQSSLMREVQ